MESNIGGAVTCGALFGLSLGESNGGREKKRVENKDFCKNIYTSFIYFFKIQNFNKRNYILQANKDVKNVGKYLHQNK